MHGNCIKHLDIAINFQCWKEGNQVYVHNPFGIPRYLNEEDVVFSYNTFKSRIIQAIYSPALSDQDNHIRVFHSLYKVVRNGSIGIKGFNTSKKKLPPVGLDLIQEIITGLGVQCLAN